MTAKTSAVLSTLLTAAFVAGTVAIPQPSAAQDAQAPEPQGQPPKGWFKACTKQEDNDVCIVQDLVAADSGQLVTAVGMILVEGKVNRKVLQVSVPAARMIQPGIGMQIDDGKTQRLEYAVCMPDKCVAEAPLSDAVINRFKRGGEVVFTSVNFQRAKNPVKISLNGFTDAFEGEPMKQSQLQERQKLLQGEMQKKAADARKKLEAAQDAAKSDQ